MDLSDPTRSVTGALDGPVLAVLAAAGSPLTVGDIAARSARGSEIGIRRALVRLTEQGIVRATEMGRNRVHDLNRDHVAAEVAELLGGLRTTLWGRFRSTLGAWRPRPQYACVFGSAARGDGDADSDIDLLLVHQPFPGERGTRTRSKNVGAKVAGRTKEILVPPMTTRQASRWHELVDDLRDSAHAWTGNPLQVVDVSTFEWEEHRRKRSKFYGEIERDAVEIFRPRNAPIFERERKV